MKNSADVVVVGGGVIGCSVLYNLASRGVKDGMLVERDILGAGSTGKSSGVTCGFSVLLFTHAHQFGEVTPRLAEVSQDIFRNFRDIVGADSGFRDTGVLFLEGRELEKSFQDSFVILQALGVDARLIDRQEAKEIAPHLEFDDVVCIGYEPGSGYADSSGVTQGYASAARGLGAKVLLGNPVLDIEVKGGKVSAVITEQGRIATETAVIAAGPWTGRIMKQLGYHLPLRSTRHQVFFLKTGPEASPDHPVVFDGVNRVYFRPESPDLTLVGDLEIDEEVDPNDFDQAMDMGLTQKVWQRAAGRMPYLGKVELFTSYTGLYTNTPDSHPVIDRVEGIDGLFICAGFNGYGFKMSPAVGLVMSELILDGEAKTVDIMPLAMGRFG
jgi:sarcosine oxidase subunit beta